MTTKEKAPELCTGEKSLLGGPEAYIEVGYTKEQALFLYNKVKQLHEITEEIGRFADELYPGDYSKLPLDKRAPFELKDLGKPTLLVGFSAAVAKLDHSPEEPYKKGHLTNNKTIGFCNMHLAGDIEAATHLIGELAAKQQARALKMILSAGGIKRIIRKKEGE